MVMTKEESKTQVEMSDTDLWNLRTNVFDDFYGRAHSPSDAQAKQIAEVTGIGTRALLQHSDVGARVRVLTEPDYHATLKMMLNEWAIDELKTCGLLGKDGDFYPTWIRMSRSTPFIVLIPYFWKKRVSYVRALDPINKGVWAPSAPMMSPYRLNDLRSHKNVVIFESELDCMKALDLGVAGIYDTGVVGLPNWAGRNKSWKNEFIGKRVWLVKTSGDKEVAYANLADTLRESCELVSQIRLGENEEMDVIIPIIREECKYNREQFLYSVIAGGAKVMKIQEIAELMSGACKKWNVGNLRSWANVSGLSNKCDKAHHKDYNPQDFAYIGLLQAAGYKMSEMHKHLPFDEVSHKIPGLNVNKAEPTITDALPEAPFTTPPRKLEDLMADTSDKVIYDLGEVKLTVPGEGKLLKADGEGVQINGSNEELNSLQMMLKYCSFMTEHVKDIMKHDSEPAMKEFLQSGVKDLKSNVEDPLADIDEALITIVDSLEAIESLVITEAYRSGRMKLI